MTTRIVTAVHEDKLTGLPILTDRYGYFHIMSRWETVLPPSIENRTYIQTLSGKSFPGTRDFYPIPNELTGEPITEYITPERKSLNIFFIMASQDLLKGRSRKGKGLEMSLLGICVNSTRVLCIPFRHDIHYVLAESLRFPEGATIELQIRPCSTRTRVGVLAGGFLTDRG